MCRVKICPQLLQRHMIRLGFFPCRHTRCSSFFTVDPFIHKKGLFNHHITGEKYPNAKYLHWVYYNISFLAIRNKSVEIEKPTPYTLYTCRFNVHQQLKISMQIRWYEINGPVAFICTLHSITNSLIVSCKHNRDLGYYESHPIL